MLIFMWLCGGLALAAWWIRGGIFSAIIVAIPLGLLSQIGTGPVAWWVYPFCFLTPWLPFAIRSWCQWIGRSGVLIGGRAQHIGGAGLHLTLRPNVVNGARDSG